VQEVLEPLSAASQQVRLRDPAAIERVSDAFQPIFRYASPIS
jgi:hypothetical protein